MKVLILALVFSIISVAQAYDEQRKRDLDYEYEQYTNFPMPKVRDCEASKEFITTLEYLRTQKYIDVVDKYAQAVSHKVSEGCTGSAARFIKNFELLMKVDAGFHAAVNISIKLAQKSEKYSDAFIGIFKKSYLKENLDLDLMTSIQLANELSAEYEGNIDFAVADYYKLTEFCMNENNVGLSKPRCALVSGRIIKRAASFDYPIADPFIKAYKFINENKLTGASVPQSLSLSEEIVAISPKAVDNFIFAYKYGLKKEGLAISAKDSLQFALNLSSRTVKNNPSPIDFDINRLPAGKEVKEEKMETKAEATEEEAKEKPKKKAKSKKKKKKTKASKKKSKKKTEA